MSKDNVLVVLTEEGVDIWGPYGHQGAKDAFEQIEMDGVYAIEIEQLRKYDGKYDK